jgi:Zn-dependent peptidase ImmA (M78 family)
VKRGFKAHAERVALAERELLALTERCRLDPRVLAESKGVPVLPISTLPDVPPEHLRRLQIDDEGAFSAAAVVIENDALIVVNDAHIEARQVSSISHELAHLLLGHEPAPAFSDLGGRNVTRDMEDEADWLAGCLLVPGSGIRATMRDCGNDLQTAADHYGISMQMMRWRHGVTQWKPRRKA